MSTAKTLPLPVLTYDWRKPVLAAYIVILAAFGGGAGWASIAKLESAAIAPGVVVTRSNKKTVQHLEGGITREILVRDGDRVQEGQVLLRLDGTQPRAALETIRNQQAIARIQEARLVAERDKTNKLVLEGNVESRATEPMIARAIEDQQSNLRERSIYLHSQIDVLRAKILQTEQEVRALNSDAEGTKQQLVTIDQELGGLRQLLAKQLVPISRVAALERERIRLQGLLNRAISDAKKGAESVDETKLSIIQLQKQFQQQVSADIIDVRRNLTELNEKENVAKDVLARLEIRAPRTGIVQALKVFTTGAVIRPGDPILEIAPTDDQLTVSVQVSPADGDSVSEGMRAEVRFPAFHSRRVPIMLGVLRAVSFDRVVDPQNPQNSYFQGEISVDSSTIPQEIKEKLKPGMPVDTIIITGVQTPLDYFLGPLIDRVGHGLREK